MDKRLNDKYSDELIKFMHGPIWALIRYRFGLYLARQREIQNAHIRRANWPEVSRLQGIIDSIPELIEITERLNVEVLRGQLDVDVAMSVIENKT